MKVVLICLALLIVMHFALIAAGVAVLVKIRDEIEEWREVSRWRH